MSNQITREQIKEMESEANMFAFFLLMPKTLIEQDLKSDYDLGNDDFVKSLFKKYEVPMNALQYRIYLLNNYNL